MGGSETIELWEGDALPAWLCGPPDNADLPVLLRRFAEAIGRPGALRLAAVLGGTTQTFWRKPRPDQPVSLAIGQDRARRLGVHLCRQGPCRFMVPYGPFSHRSRTRRAIRALLLQGYSTGEIVGRVRASEVLIRAVRREVRADGLLGLSGGGSPADPAPPPLGFGGRLNEGALLARAIKLKELIRDGRPLPEWLQGPEDNRDLPELLQEIARAIGRPKAVLIAAYLGGTRLFLSRRPNPRSRFARLIGMEDTAKLVAAMCCARSGIEIELPAGPINFARFRRWRVRQLILEGMPTDRIALEVGINRRNVNRAAAGLRAQGFALPSPWTRGDHPQSDDVAAIAAAMGAGDGEEDDL